MIIDEPEVLIDEPEVLIDEPELIIDEPELIIDEPEKEPEKHIEYPPDGWKDGKPDWAHKWDELDEG